MSVEDLKKEIAKLEARMEKQKAAPVAKRGRKVEIVETQPKNEVVYEKPPAQEKPVSRAKAASESSSESSADEAKKAAMKEKMAKLRALRGKKSEKSEKTIEDKPIPKDAKVVVEKVDTPAAPVADEAKPKRKYTRKPKAEAPVEEAKTQPVGRPRIAIRPLEAAPQKYDVHICDCVRCKESHAK